MKELLQMALDALESTATIVDSYYIERGKQYTPECDAAITALREALAAPQAEPVAWAMLRADGLVLDVICPDERDAYQGEYTVPLYAAPPAAPAPADTEGCAACVTCGQPWPAAPAVPPFDLNCTCGAVWEVRGKDVELVHTAAPVVREPIIDEMDAVASRYAHKLALDLECVLSDYNGKWWDTAMQTIGEYRMAMNRIHERESPTHMGEPVLPKISSGVGK